MKIIKLLLLLIVLTSCGNNTKEENKKHIVDKIYYIDQLGQGC